MKEKGDKLSALDTIRNVSKEFLILRVRKLSKEDLSNIQKERMFWETVSFLVLNMKAFIVVPRQ